MPSFGPRPTPPEWLTDFPAWWAKQSPENRQEFLNSIGETTGGTAGSIGGGALGSLAAPGPGTFAGGVIGAGVGTGIGRKLATTVGPLMGAAGAGPDESSKLAKAILWGGATEGAGRVPALAGQVAKAGVKHFFKPTEAAKLLTTMAKEIGLVDEAGRPLLDLAQATDSNVVHAIKLMFMRYPGAAGKGKEFATKQGEKYLSLLKDVIHAPGSEAANSTLMHERAREVLSRLQSELGDTTSAASKTAASKFAGPSIAKTPTTALSSKGNVLVPTEPVKPSPKYKEYQPKLDTSRLGLPAERRVVGPESSLPGRSPFDPRPGPGELPPKYVMPPDAIRGNMPAPAPKPVVELSSQLPAIKTNQAAAGARYEWLIKPIQKHPIYNSPVDMTELQKSSQRLLDANAWADIAGTFQGKPRKIIQQLSSMTKETAPPVSAIESTAKSIGKTVDDFRKAAAADPRMKALWDEVETFDREAAAKLSAAAEPVTFKDLDKLRSEALEVARSLNPNIPPATRTALRDLKDSIDETLRTAGEADPQFYAKWREAKDLYHSMMVKVGKQAHPSSSSGNPIVDNIRNTERMPHLVQPIISKPGAVTLAENARQAVSPTSVGRSPLTFNPFNDVGALTHSQAAKSAADTLPVSGQPYLSSSKYQSFIDTNLAGTETPIFGAGESAVRDIYSPANLAREQQLTKTPLARHLAGTSSEGTIGKMFPDMNAPVAQSTLDLFESSGINPTLKQGYLGDIARVPSGLFETYNPAAARARLLGAGKTAPAVLGDQMPQKLDTIFQVGEGLSGPRIDRIGGTSQATGVESLGRGILNAPSSPGTFGKSAAWVGSLLQGGRAMNDPKKVEWLTSPADAIFPTNQAAGAASGMAARIPAQFPPRFTPPPEPTPEPPVKVIMQDSSGTKFEVPSIDVEYYTNHPDPQQRYTLMPKGMP